MKKIIELRADPKLLKSNFDGYKLSLDPIPILRLEDVPLPYRITPNLSAGEYSEKHVSLFQLHNHLVSDPWLNNTAYYFDVSSSVQKINYDVSLKFDDPNAKHYDDILTGFYRKTKSTESSVQDFVKKSSISKWNLQ